MISIIGPVIRVQGEGESELVLVAHAPGCVCTLDGGVQGGGEERGKDGYDGDYHQKLNQRETERFLSSAHCIKKYPVAPLVASAATGSNQSQSRFDASPQRAGIVTEIKLLRNAAEPTKHQESDSQQGQRGRLGYWQNRRVEDIMDLNVVQEKR